jgi:hypothetical protein
VYRRGLCMVVAAVSVCVPGSARSATVVRAAPVRNTRFTLSSVDGCFFVPPPPGGTVWPLAPVDRPHGIRGSFNGVRGISPHFGVDVEALVNQAPVHSIASGYVSAMKQGVNHFSVRTLDQDHFLDYYHVVPLSTLHRGSWVAAGQLIGHVVKAYYHVHVAERDQPCGWINPMRPTGPLHVAANGEQPTIGPLHAYVANRAAFRRFDTGKNPKLETDPATPLELTDLHGLVDMRAEIHDWPTKRMVERPQLELETAAIRAYLAPRFNRLEHVSRMKLIFDGATLLNPARFGTSIWHLWAFGTWRDSSGYFDKGPNARTHLGAAYVWHVAGVLGLHTTRYRNGDYQYCVQALTINGVRGTRCTPVAIHN